MKLYLKAIVFLVFTIHNSNDLYSQCIDTLYLGPDTTLCQGQSLTLSAQPGYYSYLWNNNTTTASLNLNQSGVYWLKTTVLDPQTLVTNGYFTFGNMFFSTNYTYGTGGAWGILSYEGTYAISTNPSLTHLNFASFGDHTTGTGNMMIVNGSQTLNQVVWSEVVSVTPNTNYNFSAWFTSVHSSNPAILNFRINGIPLGPLINVNSTTGLWQNFFQTWNSGASTSATISITNQNNAGSGNDFAIDDIYFAKFCTLYDTINVNVSSYPTVNLGTDTTLCSSDSLPLIGGIAASYLWSNGDTSQSIFAVNSGLYSVVASNGPCKSSDTISINKMLPLTSSISNDTLLCDKATISINTLTTNGSPPYDYLWNTGSNLAFISVQPQNTQTFSVAISDLCQDTVFLSCDVTVSNSAFKLFGDSICSNDSTQLSVVSNDMVDFHWNTGENQQKIYVSPTTTTNYSVFMTDSFGCERDTTVQVVVFADYKILSSGDTSICENSALTLTVFNGVNYVWSNGSVSSSITINPSNNQVITVIAKDNNGCVDSNQIDINIIPSPVLEITAEDTICRGSSTNLTVKGADFYLWNTGSTSNAVSVMPVSNTTFSVIGTNETNGTRCSSNESVALVVKNCNTLFFPNAFTPDGDNLNDFFKPAGDLLYFEHYDFYIFNRWGRLLFHSSDKNEGWNGCDMDGNKLPTGVYVYKVVLKEILKDEFQKAGTFHLIR